MSYWIRYSYEWVPVAEGHCEAPVWNPGLKIEILSFENHVLKTIS
jgi:hypothetical protein